MPSKKKASSGAHKTPDILSEFIISFWCAPPAEETTLERYREIANCGFNLVLTWFNDIPMNRKVLDLCRKTGLKALIGDFRLWTPPDAPVFEHNLNELISDHRDHPALAGYYLRDEPHASLFPFFGAVNQHMLANDPRRLPYINLFPNYGNERLWGTRTYEEHVAAFIRIVKPALVSWDHYALLKDGERKEYFENIEIVRRLCLQAGLPFMQTILVTPCGSYRNPNEAEIRWQVYTTLCYGARGISYFTYWGPREWTNNIIDDGKRTPHYAMVRRINRRVRALGPTLMTLRSKGVYHTEPIPLGAQGLDKRSPVKGVSGGAMVIGWLKNEAGQDYLFVVNRSMKEEITGVLTLSSGVRRAMEISQSSGKLKRCDFDPSSRRLTLPLAAGEGRLVRLD